MPSVLKLKITKKSLKLAIAISTSLSGLLVIGAGWQDFQNVKVYEIETHLNNQPNYRVVQRQFDRQIKDSFVSSDSKLIARIDTGNPYGKIILTLVGLGLSSATLFMISQEDKLEELFEYIKEKELEAERLSIDTEMAVLDYTKGEHLLVRGAEEMAKLYQNKEWLRLQQNKDEILYGTNEQTGEEDSEDYQQTTADIWREAEESSTVPAIPQAQKQLCDRPLAERIYQVHKTQKISIGQAITQVSQVTSTHPDWQIFKDQLHQHLGDILRG